MRLAVPLFALVISALPVRADELQDIDRLLKQGQSAKALERVDQYLSQKPNAAVAFGAPSTLSPAKGARIDVTADAGRIICRIP